MAPFISHIISSRSILTLGYIAKLVGCSVNSFEACPIKNISLPEDLPRPLMPPPKSVEPSFVAIGFGAQNYTCTDTGNYTNVGALAELLSVSCLSKSLFNTIPDFAMTLWSDVMPNVTISDVISAFRNQEFKDVGVLGQHYFVPSSDGEGLSAKWDFTSTFRQSPEAFVIAAKVAQAAAPTGPRDIDWVSLKNVSGKLAQMVYRTDTRLGQPPANCTPGSAEIAVRYVAMYWFYGENFEH